MYGYISFSYNTNTLIMKCKGQAILIRYKDNSLYPSFTTCKKVTEMKITLLSASIHQKRVCHNPVLLYYFPYIYTVKFV